LVLPDTRTVSRMTYGGHEQGVGRREKSRTEGHKLIVELRRDARLSAALTLLPEVPTPGAGGATAARRRRPGVWANFNIVGREAVSFSSIDGATLQALVELPDFRPHVIAAGHFDPTEPVQFCQLWSLLVPDAIVTGGRILEAIEDVPTFLADWTTLTEVGQLTPGDGAFYELLGDVYVDEGSTDCAIPLPLVAPKPVSTHETAIAIAMARAGLITGRRISTQDRPDVEATVSRSFAFYEFPNPNVVEMKVRDFLLNRRHPKARWRDLADRGYFDHGDGGLILASTLASVFHGSFETWDVRPTADAALQFTVPVILPSAHAPLPLITSWTYRDGPAPGSSNLHDDPTSTARYGLWLSTAHVDRSCEEYAAPAIVPFEPTTCDWNELVTFVEAEARSACTRFAADGVSAVGFLWVPRGVGRQAEFFRWIRLNRDVRTHRRRAYGGSVALYSLVSLRTYESETGVSTAMRLAQTLLGMVGIRSHVSVHFD
jgi:hypothetical protein